MARHEAWPQVAGGKATVASHGPQMANGGKASAEALGEQFLREMVGYSEEE